MIKRSVLQIVVFPFLLFVFSFSALAKEYSQDIFDTPSFNQEEFFLQTFGSGFQGDLTTLSIKLTSIPGFLYPSNFVLKEWSDASYSADYYVQSFTPCSIETNPLCNDLTCEGSEWDSNTDYLITLDYSCHAHTFDITHYYALGMHGGNLNNSFKVLGSSSDAFIDGVLMTGPTNFIANCFYGTGPTWGGWQYNQISTQTSLCYVDESVFDMYFEFPPYDTTPPVVESALDPISFDGNNSWYVSVPTVTISSSDSDLDYIEYVWDDANSSWTAYTTPLLGLVGEHTLYYRGYDVAGNVSENYSKLIKVDTISPNVSAVVTPTDPDGDNNWYVNSPTISLGSTSSDVSSYSYSYDNSTWSVYSSSVEVPDGEKTFYYKSEDTAGNKSATEFLSIKVDTKDPASIDDFEAEYEKDTGYIKLSWDVADKEDHYVLIKKSTNKDFSDSDKLTENPTDDENHSYKSAKPGKKYYFRAWVVDEAGNKSGKESVSIRVLEEEEVFVSPTFVEIKKETPLSVTKPEVKGIAESKPMPSPKLETHDLLLKEDNSFVIWLIIILLLLGALILILWRVKSKREKAKYNLM